MVIDIGTDEQINDHDRYLMRERLLNLAENRGEHLYAVIDIARDPFLLFAVLEGFGGDRQCLFRGQAREELGDQTAWIVRIERQAGLLDWLLDEGWNKRLVSFVVSPLLLSRLTTHLRKFTKIRDTEGVAHFFRFYDPQVLRQYLPVFGQREHEMFFRSISCCAIEDSRNGDRMLIGRSREGRVEWETWRLKALPETSTSPGKPCLPPKAISR